MVAHPKDLIHDYALNDLAGLYGTQFYIGTLTAVDSLNNKGNVTIPDVAYLTDVPIHYHVPTPTHPKIESSGSSFNSGDQVLLMKRGDSFTIIGFSDRLKFSPNVWIKLQRENNNIGPRAFHNPDSIAIRPSDNPDDPETLYIMDCVAPWHRMIRTDINGNNWTEWWPYINTPVFKYILRGELTTGVPMRVEWDSDREEVIFSTTDFFETAGPGGTGREVFGAPGPNNNVNIGGGVEWLYNPDDGFLYFSDPGNNNVVWRRHTYTASTFESVNVVPTSSPGGYHRRMAINWDGPVIYFYSLTAQKIFRFVWGSSSFDTWVLGSDYSTLSVFEFDNSNKKFYLCPFDGPDKGKIVECDWNFANIKKIGEFENSSNDPGKFTVPRKVIHHNGFIYVVDFGNKSVVKTTMDYQN